MSDNDRAGERRSGDRRAGRRSVFADESWFGAFSSDADTQLPDEPPPTAPDATGGYRSHFDEPPPPSRADKPKEADDSRFLTREATRMVESGQTAFERLYRAFIAARAALGVALVLAIAVGGLFGLRPAWWITLISVAYAAAAVSLWALPRFRHPTAPRSMARLGSPQWLATIGVDLLCFIALHVLAPGTSLNYVALLVLPVLMAGVLTPRKLALATVAVITIALLVAAWLGAVGGTEGTLQMTQAALAGAGFFVITLLAGELAGRLAREELTARGSLEMARQQAQ
ncbi:MAG: histidine kinase, partial [Burkholderiales bacterium]